MALRLNPVGLAQHSQNNTTPIDFENNMTFLNTIANRLECIYSTTSTLCVERIHLPEYDVTVSASLLAQPPEYFRFIVMHMVEQQHSKRFKPVGKTFGKTFHFKKSMKYKFPHCTICQEPFEKNQKIRTLHTNQCSFHARCINKWFKKSSRCPNCNVDCSQEQDDSSRVKGICLIL